MIKNQSIEWDRLVLISKLMNVSGKEDAGLYIKISNVTLNGCIMKCCESDNCNVVFMNKNDCYTVTFTFTYYDYIHWWVNTKQAHN